MKQFFRGMPKEAKSSSLFYSQLFGVKHDSQVGFFSKSSSNFRPRNSAMDRQVKLVIWWIMRFLFKMHCCVGDNAGSLRTSQFDISIFQQKHWNFVVGIFPVN